jgi:hypothetical protein
VLRWCAGNITDRNAWLRAFLRNAAFSHASDMRFPLVTRPFLCGEGLYEDIFDCKALPLARNCICFCAEQQPDVHSRVKF